MPLIPATGQPAAARPATTPVVSELVTRRVARERIAAQLDQLGPLPAIAMEVVQLTADPASSVKQLEEKIACDPVITAKVFKLANSSFYCKGEPSRSLQAAGTRLGMTTIRNLVLSSCAGTKLARPLDHYAYESYGMWKHSLALALTAVDVAPILGMRAARADELFLGGLMHDVGKLIVDPLLGDSVTGTGGASLDVERRLLGVTHPQMGLEIAQRWNLPEFVGEVILHHHAPSQAGAGQEVVAAIHVLDVMMNSLMIGLEEDVLPDECIEAAALEMLRLDDDALMDLREHVAGCLPDIIPLCEAML